MIKAIKTVRKGLSLDNYGVSSSFSVMEKPRAHNDMSLLPPDYLESLFLTKEPSLEGKYQPLGTVAFPHQTDM